MRHGKIICVGWNYRSHLAETDKQLPQEPVIFLKPSSCLIGDGEPIVIPEGIENVQYEAELALIFGRSGKNISRSDALSFVSHAAAFNDVTARDMQTAARKKGDPWSIAKGMDTFGPMSRPVRIDGIDVQDLDVQLTLNGIEKQRSNTSMMIFSIAEVIEYVSRFMIIEKGDILATGTPEGIGPMKKGDEVRVSIPGVGSVSNRVV